MEYYEKIKSMIIGALENVEENYYKLKYIPKRINSKKDINYLVRERYFCYEFYHQIRKIDEKQKLLDDEIVISAEIHKQGYSSNYKNKIPDFIIHEPGKNNNIAVIEVKGVIDARDIAKDFNTLSLFISDCGYSKGIFILFNHTLQELKDKMDSIMEQKNYKNIENKNVFEVIEVICKKYGIKEETEILSNLIENNHANLK